MNPKPCRLCASPRWATTSWCYRHYREREKAKKIEKANRKLLRKQSTKKFKENEKKKLINKCDIVFSLLIRKQGYCLWPETEADKHKGASQCSHIFSRRHMAIRWLELNAKPLCAGHHFKWHKHPAEATLFLTTIRTMEEIKWLKAQTVTIKQWTLIELKALLADLQAKLLE